MSAPRTAEVILRANGILVEAGIDPDKAKAETWIAACEQARVELWAEALPLVSSARQPRW